LTSGEIQLVELIVQLSSVVFALVKKSTTTAFQSTSVGFLNMKKELSQDN
jgi:hypothetical protein